MTTRVPIRYGGTGANTAAGARDALGVLANTGGTISGDLTITGNLVVSGNSTTINTETLIVEDNEIVLNSNVAGSPTLNSGLIVNRGSSPNTFLRWNEGTDKWGWSDDGTTFYSFDSGLNAYGQANAAYGQANAAYGQANLAYGQANAAYSQANLAYDAANNAKVTVYANNASNITTQKINFVNTATVTVSVTADGSNANIAFTSLGGGGSLSNIRVSQNSSGTINANGFNFVNTSSVTIAVNQGTDGNANISFTANKTNTVIRSETFTAANADANLTYSILYYPSSVEYVFVNKNGISLVPVTDFTLTGNTVTLIDSGESGDNIEIRYFVDVSTVPATNTTIVVESNTVASQTSTFTLSQNVATINRLTVTKNGLQLTPNTHYTLANGKEVTLTTVAEVNDELVFRYFLDLGNIQDIALLAYNQANLAYTAANNRVLKAGDTMTGNLNVAASLITQNVEPNLNVTYNLGTTTKRFKDLWLSNSTIYLGDAQITANGSKLVVGALELTSGANVSNAVLKTGDTMTGNLTFSGNGLRILGDFSNATTNNRLLFQTTAANETTRITAIPSGTGPGAQFRAHNTIDGVNFGATVMYCDSTSGYLNVGAAGSSPFLPLQFQLGGGEKLRIDANGNFGLGTSSPSTYGILAIKKNSTSAPPYIVLDNRGLDTTDANTYTQGGLLFGAYRDISNPAYIASITVARTSASGGASSGGDIVFGANSVPTTGIPTERMRITSNGDVGIGTTTPPSPLSVVSRSGINGGASILLTGNTNNERIVIRASASGGGGGTPVFSAFGSQGTPTSPSASLSGDQMGYYQLGGYDGTNWVRSAWITGLAAENYSSTNRGSHMAFSTTPIGSTTIAERMRIEANGNVGIGTTNPSGKLHVESAGANYVYSRNSSNTGQAGFICQNTGDTRGIRIDGGSLDLYDFSAGATRMRIDAGGRVIVGNSASSGVAHEDTYLQVRTTGNVFIGTTGGSYGNDRQGFVLRRNGVYGAQIEAAAAASINTYSFNQYDHWYWYMWDGTNRTSAARIEVGGAMVLRGALTQNGTPDYAEYFEWEDQNVNGENRKGKTVVLNQTTGKIRLSTPDDSPSSIIGVCSRTYGVILDSQEFDWSEKYLKDEFGEFIKQEVQYVKYKEITGEERSRQLSDGSVPNDATNVEYFSSMNNVVNPNYDPNKEYIPRSKRKEWEPIGLVGKLRVLKGQKIGDRWIKMRDISETVEEWLVR